MTATWLEKYDTMAMILHWVIAALLITMLIFGETMNSTLLREEAERAGITAFGLGMPAASDLGLPMGVVHA